MCQKKSTSQFALTAFKDLTISLLQNCWDKGSLQNRWERKRAKNDRCIYLHSLELLKDCEVNRGDQRWWQVVGRVGFHHHLRESKMILQKYTSSWHHFIDIHGKAFWQGQECKNQRVLLRQKVNDYISTGTCNCLPQPRLQKDSGTFQVPELTALKTHIT